LQTNEFTYISIVVNGILVLAVRDCQQERISPVTRTL